MTLSEQAKRANRRPQQKTHKTCYDAPLPWFVYIGQAPTCKYYTGISTDPRKRIETHNSDKGAKFSRDQGALRLLYVSPPFETKSAARKREIQIKGWTREKKEKLIRGEWQ